MEFTDSQIKKLNLTSIAEKRGVTSQYVGQVLRGEKGKNDLSEAIRNDARKILTILEDPILNIEVVEPEIVEG